MFFNHYHKNRGREALKHVSTSINSILKGQPLLLKFPRLGSFGGNVLFVDVDDETRATLTQIAG